MNYAASLNLLNSGNEKTLISNNENIQDEYNYDFYMHSDKNVPSHTLTIDNNFSYYIILSDSDEYYYRINILGKSTSNQYYVETELKNLTRKYFVLQEISKTKLPTERALRSDVLLI